MQRRTDILSRLPGKEGKGFAVEKQQISGKSPLRQKAEKLLRKKKPVPLSIMVQTSKEPINFTDSETQRIIYELEVHQIELELQNQELKLAKKQLEALADKYTQLYDFSPAGYFTLSNAGDIIDVNMYGSQMLGKERIKLKNSRFGFFISDGSKPEFNHFLDTLFRDKCTASCDITLDVWKGEFPVNVTLTGIFAGEKDQCLIAAVDISERKWQEEEIKHKNNELQRVNAEKDRFLSIIAHDLRSPFNGFLGLTELMAKGLSGMSFDEIHKIVLMMKSGATNLSHLLTNLLEWSRMERGLIAFSPKLSLLKPCMDDGLVFVRESAMSKEIIIDNQIPDEQFVYGDSTMLESLFRNLVSNAVKFTPHGGMITLSAEPLSDKWLEFLVKDNGIGMDKNLRENLFRLDVNIGRKGTDGELSTGLGLIICKEIIEKHGGEIWVESEDKKGSIFHFTLPLRPF